MLKKFKILLLIIALTASGIVLVLGIWLYGSYKNRQELFLGTAERSLFNVLQNYYQNEVSAAWKKEQMEPLEKNKRYEALMGLLKSVYPDIDLAKFRSALDTSELQRMHIRRVKQLGRGKDAPDQLLPLYLLEKMNFNDQLLDTLETRLLQAFDRNKIEAKFELRLEEIKQNEFDLYYGRKARKDKLMTRPILVNPAEDQFLVAKFQAPWGYYISKMWMQVLFSILLLIALLGTFIYLLKTIKKQNELALLRRSFINNMTHELKTPVATVMAAIEAIQHFGAKHDKVKMEKYLELSKLELEHLHEMIERVLELNVDETNGVVLALSRFDVRRVVEGALQALQVSSRKEVHISRDLPEEPLFIVGDESHLRNVVANLLDNAVKYSEEPVLLHISLTADPDRVHLSISDKGKGIDPMHQKQIFDMFYRVPEGNLHAVKGFGLGLAYVKQVVNRHGGEIIVRSALGEGSTFTVSLPKKDTVLKKETHG